MSGKNDHTPEELIRLAGERSGNLFDAGGYCCSEAVLLAVNQGFGGGLSPEAALNLGAGFCGGLGGAGCLCGGLGGATAALGLFLGPHGKGGMRKKKFRSLSKLLHDRFRDRFESTCCRVLLKKADAEGRKKHDNCTGLTMVAAELVVELLLANRPELADRADLEFLRKKETKIEGKMKKIFGKL